MGRKVDGKEIRTAPMRKTVFKAGHGEPSTRKKHGALEGVNEICCAKGQRNLKGGNVRDGREGKGQMLQDLSTTVGPRVKRWSHLSRGSDSSWPMRIKQLLTCG